jgi:ribosomal silencing factor RsfS
MEGLRAENAHLREQLAARELELARLMARQRALEEQLAEAGQVVERLDYCLAERDRMNRASRARFALLEQQASRLLKLYVAIQRLHEASDREQVLVAIQEIVIHIIGSEELALFRLEPGAQRLMLVTALGVDADRLCSLALGQGPIGETAISGTLFIASTPARAGERKPDAVSACVPLRMGGQVHGVLTLFGLLPQKRKLDEVDIEVLTLLGVHAAPTLHRAELLRLATSSSPTPSGRAA